MIHADITIQCARCQKPVEHQDLFFAQREQQVIVARCHGEMQHCALPLFRMIETGWRIVQAVAFQPGPRT